MSELRGLCWRRLSLARSGDDVVLPHDAAFALPARLRFGGNRRHFQHSGGKFYSVGAGIYSVEAKRSSLRDRICQNRGTRSVVDGKFYSCGVNASSIGVNFYSKVLGFLVDPPIPRSNRVKICSNRVNLSSAVTKISFAALKITNGEPIRSSAGAKFRSVRPNPSSDGAARQTDRAKSGPGVVSRLKTGGSKDARFEPFARPGCPAAGATLR